MGRQRKRNHRGRTPLRHYLEEHPEQLANRLGNLVFVFPLREDGTMNTDVMEMRDLATEKLFGYVESSGTHLRCPGCKAEYTISHTEWEQLFAIATSSKSSIRLGCSQCKRKDPILSLDDMVIVTIK